MIFPQFACNFELFMTFLLYIQYILGHRRATPADDLVVFLRLKVLNYAWLIYADFVLIWRQALLEMHDDCKGACVFITHTQREPRADGQLINAADSCLINCQDNDEIKRDHGSIRTMAWLTFDAT